MRDDFCNFGMMIDLFTAWDNSLERESFPREVAVPQDAFVSDTFIAVSVCMSLRHD